MPDGLSNHITIDQPATKRSRGTRSRKKGADLAAFAAPFMSTPVRHPDASDAAPLLAALKAGACKTPLGLRLMSVTLSNIENCSPHDDVPGGIYDDLDQAALAAPVTSLSDVAALISILGTFARFNPNEITEGCVVEVFALMRQILDAVMPWMLAETSLSPGELGLGDFSVRLEDAHHAHIRAHIVRWTGNVGVTP